MEIKTVGEIKIPVIIPRVDASNAKGVEANLSELIKNGTKKMICNFSQNEYISSAGLRVFLTILKTLQRSGGKVVLCGFHPYVREVFDMAGFSQLFKIFETEEEAIKEIQ